jgi:BioD-like phosphotransacetylase family protein
MLLKKYKQPKISVGVFRPLASTVATKCATSPMTELLAELRTKTTFMRKRRQSL